MGKHSNKLNTLQYLRAIAALVVVYSHTVTQVPMYEARLLHFGGFGVDIFFVISGFIMVFIARPGDTPRRFLTNRISRVVPLYWAMTLLMAVILLIAPDVFKTAQYDTVVVLKSLFFIPHFSQSYPDMLWPIVAPGWSLNYEMYFYCIFAIALLAPLRHQVWVISAIIAVVYVLATLSQSNHPVSLFLQDAIVFEFVLGMLLAKTWLAGWRVGQWTALSLIVAGFVILLMDLPLPRLVSFGIPSLMVVIGTLNFSMPRIDWMVLLGDSSYALYLWHIFALGLCRKIFPPLLGDSMMGAVLFVVLSLLTCILTSLPVHWYIDNWLLKRERLASFKSAEAAR